MVKTKSGQFVDRLSPWATYVKPPPTKDQGIAYNQFFWNPPASEVRPDSNPPASEVKPDSNPPASEVTVRPASNLPLT